MLTLEPVTISSKKMAEGVGRQVVKVFVSENLSPDKNDVPPHPQQFSYDDLLAVSQEGVRRGIELALWKFVASLEKCEAFPESDFMKEVLVKVATEEAMRGSTS